MREVLPAEPSADCPVSEELKEETRTWVEPPKPPSQPARTEQAADRPRAVRYDLD